jgi:DNA repair protein RadC
MIIGTATAAADMFAPIFASVEGERVAVLHLRQDRRFLALTLEQQGGQADVELPIRAILAGAMRVGADAIIVAHNHPSGDTRPSAADLSATRALAMAAHSVDIRLQDHLIFAAGSWRSFCAEGLL